MHLTTILTDVVDDIRQPEYTGPNRCLPCTLVNLVLAVALAGAEAVAGSLSLGLGVFLVAVTAIYVRGYLVPGTPALTKRYLPDAVLRWFEASHPRHDVDAEFDVTAALDEFGLLVDDPRGDVQLDPDFTAAWFERMTARDVYVPQLGDLAALLDVDVDQLDARYHGSEACTVYLDDQWFGQWESAAAFNADVTAEALLAERHPEWSDFSLVEQGELLAALRVCLEVCPACDGRVTLGTRTVESCCRSVDVVAATCEACAARLFEVEYDPRVFEEADV